MSEARRKTFIYALLVIAVIWGVYNNPFQSSPQQDMELTDLMLSPDMLDPGQIAPMTDTQADYPEFDSWKDDPFVRKNISRKYSVNTTPKRKSVFALSAISKSGSLYMAIINGQVVRENQTIEGWTVTGIDENSATLSKGSKKVQLLLERR